MADITPLYSPLVVGRCFIGTINSYNPFKGVPITDSTTDALLYVQKVIKTKDHYTLSVSVNESSQTMQIRVPIGTQLLLLNEKELNYYKQLKSK